MKFVMLYGAALSAMVSLGASAAGAATVLDSTLQCSAGNAVNGIAVGDVTGNNGGADDCWGTLNGNDLGAQGSGPYTIGARDFVLVDPQIIGLSWTSGTSGIWSFTTGLTDDFLIVLKASSKPGHGIWSFFGTSNTSTTGTFSIAWLNNGGQIPAISHVSVYSASTADNLLPPVPLPAAGFLLLGGLGGLAAFSRRKRRAV